MLGEVLSSYSTSASARAERQDRKSTRLNSSHANISYAVFCLKKKKQEVPPPSPNHEPNDTHYEDVASQHPAPKSAHFGVKQVTHTSHQCTCTHSNTHRHQTP